jgi:uracil-DNA glycosylase
MPCVNGQNFTIPAQGDCRTENLRFHVDGDRALFCAMIGNTQLISPPPPTCKVAIVGLSPADTQLQRFNDKYNRGASYEEAALEAAFEGLGRDLVRMMNGLGVARKLGFHPLSENIDLNRSGHFLTTSLIKCASLTVNGSSSDFDPWKYESNVRCITERFVPEMLKHASIEHILVLGRKAQKALTSKVRMHGVFVHDYLNERGKVVSYLPHPSGANRESVDLASLGREDFPRMQQHQDRMWAKYITRQREKGEPLGDEASYKSTRASRWTAIARIRSAFDAYQIAAGDV